MIVPIFHAALCRQDHFLHGRVLDLGGGPARALAVRRSWSAYQGLRAGVGRCKLETQCIVFEGGVVLR
jgi:hypothetical protein